MRCVGFPLLSLTLMSSFQTSAAQAKRPVSPEDLVDIRRVYDANVSPDGNRIAFVVSEPGDSSKPQTPRDENIWMVPADGSEPARLFASSPQSDNAPRWSPDTHWLAFLSDRGEDAQKQIWLMRADGGEAEKITNAKAGVDRYKWSPDGQKIAFVARDALTDEEQKKQEQRDDPIHVDHNGKYARLWVLNLNDRKSALITRQDIEVMDFDWSPDGTSLAIAFTSNPGFLVDLTYHLAVVRESDGHMMRNLTDNAGFPLNIQWSPDGTAILFFGSAPKGGSYWMSLVSPQGGQVRFLLKDYPATFWKCLWTRDSKHLIGEAIAGTRVRLVRIDTRSGEVSTLADVLNGSPDFTATADGHVLAFVNERADSPGDVWSLTTGLPPRQLTDSNPQVASLRLGNVREVSWTNRKDRQVLHGILVTPADFRSGQPYPTIVEAHSGNAAWWSGWQGSWFQWAQLLACNGYVVFLPNVRGVTGMGWESAEFSRTWIPGTAFDDTMNGVDYLIDQKIADPNRLGIGGWSNGGLMTAWAITHTNRFKAAVQFAAPVDFPLMWGASVAFLRSSLEKVFEGTPMSARQTYEANSALSFVHNCKTPTLILHGEADTAVPIAQAYEFYHALKSLGVETELVVYPREGHSIEERAHQIDFQKRMLAWYENHLK